MRAFPWILGGGAAVAAATAYYWRHKQGTSQSPSGTASATAASSSKALDALEPLPGRWVWPVGVWQQRRPVISDGFGSKRRLPNGEQGKHGGVDIMYRRQPADSWRPGTPNGTKGYVMPDHRAVLAASDGVVWSASLTPRGWTIIVDHSPRKIATYYTHMSSLLAWISTGTRSHKIRPSRRWSRCGGDRSAVAL